MERTSHPYASLAKEFPEVEDVLRDQSLCWEQGKRITVETYFDRYPHLKEDRELALDLICHEVLLRGRKGESVDPEDYLRRFPDFAEELHLQFEVRRAFTDEEKAPSTVQGELPLAAPAAETPSQVAEYAILKELGHGGMGIVYLARHVGLKRLVALKMIRSSGDENPRALARFRREAQVLAQLQHPNIVAIYEVGEWEGRPFFALEYLPGGSLERRLKGQPQPPRAAAQLLFVLSRAVDAAHQAGVVHRDLKPANIMLASDDTPKISDFGIAKQVDAAGPTNTGDLLGTPHYMAPEQAHGRRGSVGPWSDVYALGAILYELLTGRPPFNGATVWDTLEQVVSRDPIPPSRLQGKVPHDLEIICLKCLAKEPPRRYLRAADLAGDLHRFLAGQPIRARATPVWERAWRWARRRPACAALAAVSVLSVLGLLVAGTLWLKASASDFQARAASARAEALEANQREALTRARFTIQDGLQEVEAACQDQRWKEAASRLDGVAPQLEVALQGFPHNLELTDLRWRLDDLRRRVDMHLTSRERLARFRTLRTEAGFLVMGLAGTDLEAREEWTRAVVARAFALLGAKWDAGDLPHFDPAMHSAANVQEIREGCCEMLLGLAHFAFMQPSKKELALTLIDRASRFNVARGVCHSRRSRCVAMLGQTEAAKEQERLACAYPPRRGFEFFLHGCDVYEKGDLQGSIGAFEAALACEPNHAAAAYALAVPHLRLRSQPSVERRGEGASFPAKPAEEAAEHFHLLAARMSLNICISQEPGLCWPYLCRAFTHGELGDWSAAEEDFQLAAQRLRQRPDAGLEYALLVSRGALRLRSKQWPAAIEDLASAVRIKPRDYQAHVNLARAYQLTKRPEEALRHMDQSIEFGPPSLQAALRRTRARLHQEAGRIAEAARDLEECANRESAAKAPAASADDWLALGQLLAKSDDFDGGLRAFDAALQVYPEHSGALRARAETLLRLDRHGDALQDLDRLLHSNVAAFQPVSLAALYRARAVALAKKGNHQGAVEDYTLAIATEPHAPEARRARSHRERGWSYLALEAPILARADFDQAVRLNSTDGDAHNGLAFALVTLGRYRDAADEAEQALRLGPAVSDGAPDARPAEMQARHFANAARVFAMAFLRSTEEAAVQKGASRGPRLDYQDRAVALLREAFNSLPPAQRSAFWSARIQRDRALNPIRQSHSFRQFAMEVGTALGH